MTNVANEPELLQSWLLDVFVASAILMWCASLANLDLDYREDPVVLLRLISIPLLLAVLWLLWRVCPQLRRTSSLLFSATCLVAALLSGSFQGIPLMWIAIIQLVFSWDRRWAVSYVTLTGLTVFGIHLAIRSGLLQAVQESIGAMLMMVGGLICALLLEELTSVNRERSLANAKLKRQISQNQDLTISQERARIANALHDSLGHKLTAVCMSLDYVAKTVTTRPQRALSETQVARGLTSEAIDDMRKVVRAMNPISIDENPLTTIRTLARSFSTTNLKVSFESDVLQLPEEQALLALRFAQEALTNVVRHSNGTEVSMHLSADEAIKFRVHDNGHITRDVVPGFGIRSLELRAAELGATVSFCTSNGFDVSLVMPAMEVSS